MSDNLRQLPFLQRAGGTKDSKTRCENHDSEFHDGEK
jgi:hypothetical protein